ncbi:MAG: hypothetical protein J0H44_30415 [Alphaproteobacteria bacterium]|nr:hypothetical protein [Alphaproteobacteria bacterium]
MPGVTIPWSALPPAPPPIVPPPNIPPPQPMLPPSDTPGFDKTFAPQPLPPPVAQPPRNPSLADILAPWIQPPDAEPPPPALPPSETPGLDKAIARINAPTPGFHLTPGLGGFSQPPMWSLPPPPQLLPMPPLPVPPRGGGLGTLGSTLSPIAPAPSPLIRTANGPAAPTMPQPGIGIPETLAQLARRLMPYATEMGAALGRTLPSVGAAGAGAFAAAPFLLMPSNTGSTTIDLGDGLRTSLPPGQRYVPIERRVAPGVFGTDVGAIWKQVPGLYGEVDPGRGVLVDPEQLREALGDEAANRILNTPGIMPMAKPPSDEQLPSLPGNNSASTPEPDNDQEPPKEPPHVDVTNPVSKGKNYAQASKGSSPGHRNSNGWGRPSTLAKHFTDHGADFAATDEEDYARQAQAFRQRALQKGLPTKIDPNGISRIYDPITNIFGAYNANGTTRTFYKPDPALHGYPTNMDYWNAQPGLLQGSP